MSTLRPTSTIDHQEHLEMSIRVGINGCGRIGRNVYRAAKKAGADIDLVAVNDLTSPEINAHLLKYDSTHGVLPVDVKATGDGITAGDDSFKVLAERDPKALPWGDLGVRPEEHTSELQTLMRISYAVFCSK